MPTNDGRKHLNLIAPMGDFTFGRLVADSFEVAGVEVHAWDYRRDVNPSPSLFDRAAPTLALRGECVDIISPVLDWLSGPRFLWYAEDLAKDDGVEFLRVVFSYDEIWIHCPSDFQQGKFLDMCPEKRVSVVPTLYADQSIWKPSEWNIDKGQPIQSDMCEIMHFGSLTPRREAMVAGIKTHDRHYQAKGEEAAGVYTLGLQETSTDTIERSGYSLYQYLNVNHHFLARAVNRAKVVVNLHAWSDVNLETRIAEVMSCGALLVSEALPGMDEIVGLVRHDPVLIWVCPAGDAGNMVEMIDALIENNWQIRSERRDIIAGYAKDNFSHLRIAQDIGPKIFGKDEWADGHR